ncbi:MULTISPECIES: hypothetical protein [unclassified Bradyrhizobium]|uniref:hypothetical protein n=1 Tax=unclassified Bradyrhizobium TaxID=2631580 RepID=UPI001FFBD8CD|nr:MULTISPECIES: hypothetical protein [unclassified Bradyrhizobium]MCK1583922.1 hypothetical protein [Bradyrhizobium sp. 168]MCK1602925.1 hypothetical protein [Bradyrhizobium sp. 166]MCK1689105.1 hypothetical protein [Bradyrhizobium sp. 145]MCK1702805.1 hypothetical protein [Bradyrhizobium sp. 146]
MGSYRSRHEQGRATPLSIRTVNLQRKVPAIVDTEPLVGKAQGFRLDRHFTTSTESLAELARHRRRELVQRKGLVIEQVA